MHGKNARREKHIQVLALQPNGAINAHDPAPDWHLRNPWRHDLRRLQRAMHRWLRHPMRRRTVAIASAESATHIALVALLLRYTRMSLHRSMVAATESLGLEVRGRNLAMQAAPWANTA